MWAVRHELAIEGFRALGPQARSAVPEIVQALVRGKGMFGYPLTPALVAIGDDSVPPIVDVMTNLANPKELRIHAVCWLGLCVANSFATSNLIACFKTGTRSRLASAGVLAAPNWKWKLFSVSDESGRTCQFSIRKNVASCIGAYGQKRVRAVPILLELEKDSSGDVRASATNAMFVIDRTLLPPGATPRGYSIE